MAWFRHVGLSVVPALCIVLVGFSGARPCDGSETARLDTYVKADGESFFALSLSTETPIAAAAQQEITVLFDTSASQTGQYREQAFAALEAMLANVDRQTQLRLFAVDLNAISLTGQFVAPGSDGMRDALAKLRRRVPLGSTDMLGALLGGADSFTLEPKPNDAKPSAARSLIYIGDGISGANLVGTDQFGELVRTLVDRQISFTSYAVGPQVDSQVLATLANQTGGNLAVAAEVQTADAEAGISAERARSENLRAARQCGQFLAQAACGPVLWPKTVEFSQPVETYPSPVPPLRNDRDTIVLGVGQLHGTFKIKLETRPDAGRASSTLTWSVRPNPPSEDHAYLAELVTVARRDQGLSLPTIGTAGLKEAARVLQGDVHGLTRFARHAVATGQLENAELLAGEALRRDPGNPLAMAVRKSVQKMRATAAAPVGVSLKLTASSAPAAQPPADDDAVLDSAIQGGAFLDAVERQNAVVTQMIQAEIRAQLEAARRNMATDPEAVIQELKLALAHIRRAPELNPDVRAQLIDQVESALREASRREVEFTEEQRLAQEAVAAARERQQLTMRLEQRQQKAKQLMDRLSSLVAEGRYREAEEGVGPEVVAVIPQNSEPVAAIISSRVLRYHQNNQEIVSARNRAFVDTLEQVERSAVPFPDEPPIVYPDADVWEELTLRRRQYASVDLKQRGSAEDKIYQALDESTTIEFFETPLKDVIGYLKDLHSIEIQLDRRPMEDVGVGTETPITRNLKGITLRSALRLMLRDLDLTYTIRDEVLLITTPEEVETHLTTKVYPVADLVLPIPQGGGMGGMGMGGMGMGGGMGGMGMGGGMGGMGGGMGGMGGGMGGFGGGMGGMGGGMGGFGGGGGGGFF